MKDFCERFERLFGTHDDTLPAKADVVICIGTDVSRDGKTVSPQSRSIADAARGLFLRGVVDNILFSGGYTYRDGPSEAVAMEMFVLRASPSTISTESRGPLLWFETTSRRTHGNADCTLRIMKAHRWHTAIVIAQQWHARRVRATFTKRWRGSGIHFAVVKAYSPYAGDNSTIRLKSFWRFFLWDTASFVLGKIRGWC